MKREVSLVDKPGAPQTQIRIGWIGVARSTPDYFPIQVMNTILGGSFTSRLNMNLREKHGYAYGASSAFDMRAAPGPFAVGRRRADRQDGRVAEGVLQRAECDSAAGAGRRALAGEELHRAAIPPGSRRRRIFRGASRTRSSITCPTTTSRSTSRTSRRSPPADVQRVATKYIQPDRLAVVVVGDRKAIEPGIRALNLGPIKALERRRSLPAPRYDRPSDSRQQQARP